MEQQSCGECKGGCPTAAGILIRQAALPKHRVEAFS